MSIDSQITEMLATAERAGISVQAIKRESHSAKQSATRPIFYELVEDIKIGKYDAILTWAPDRLSRNAGDLGALVDLMDAGKLYEIRTYGQSFRNTPNEKFLLMILCSQAKLENDNKGVTIKRGMRARAALGWRPGNIPIGYINRTLNGRKDIVTDPQYADTIREIFERVAVRKQSGRDIKKWLDETGFLSKRGKPLSLSQVYNILQNTFYYGEFAYPKGGELKRGSHEPLITKELFQAARRTINQQANSRAKWGTKQLPYQRAFICGHCSNSMIAEQTGSYVYYRCSGYTKDKGRCSSKALPLSSIGKQIITATNKGIVKRSHFIPTFNEVVDQHYDITKKVMQKKGIDYHSNTRLRDYINYVFSLEDTKEGEVTVRNLTEKPLVLNGRISFHQ